MSTVANRHCSPGRTSSFVYNRMYSWIIVRHLSVVLIAWSQNHLIPGWTYDQSWISLLHSSAPVDKPYCIRNSSWDIRTESSWKTNYEYTRFPTESQEWPKKHIRWQYECAGLRYDYSTDEPRPLKIVAAPRLFWTVQNIRGRSRITKILQGSWRTITNSTTLLGVTILHDLWIRGESSSEPWQCYWGLTSRRCSVIRSWICRSVSPT